MIKQRTVKKNSSGIRNVTYNYTGQKSWEEILEHMVLNRVGVNKNKK